MARAGCRPPNVQPIVDSRMPENQHLSNHKTNSCDERRTTARHVDQAHWRVQKPPNCGILLRAANKTTGCVARGAVGNQPVLLGPLKRTQPNLRLLSSVWARNSSGDISENLTSPRIHRCIGPMAHEIAKLILEHAGTFLEREEAIRTALSLGMPLEKIEEYLDWIDHHRPMTPRQDSDEPRNT